MYSQVSTTLELNVYDIFHRALLGYVKYLWKATINHSDVKKDPEALALLGMYKRPTMTTFSTSFEFQTNCILLSVQTPDSSLAATNNDRFLRKIQRRVKAD